MYIPIVRVKFAMNLITAILGTAVLLSAATAAPDQDNLQNDEDSTAATTTEPIPDSGCQDKRARELQNEEIALKMYQEAFGNHDPTAIDRYMNPKKYIQHNPWAADGTESVKEFVKEFTKGKPKGKVDIRKVASVGDMVWMHVKMKGFKGEDLAIVDIFRFEDGKIVEHWDVIQPIPELSESKNPHPMF